ncbi:MAG: type II toxin-antitoxin system VapC family toxin [Chloroflexota bacterium]|nr:MAG: type II toxin-antitoxin system VapC family toxin [Chloroflexota bacterium]
MDITELCLDTSILINFLKGREPSASAVTRAVSDYPCAVTSITVYELLFGMARAQKQIGETALLGVMQILPFDDAAARRAAILHDELIRNNQEIGIKDVLIAAICLEHNLPLVTTNMNHFMRVPALRVITPQDLLVQDS